MLLPPIYLLYKKILIINGLTRKRRNILETTTKTRNIGPLNLTTLILQPLDKILSKKITHHCYYNFSGRNVSWRGRKLPTIAIIILVDKTFRDVVPNLCSQISRTQGSEKNVSKKKKKIQKRKNISRTHPSTHHAWEPISNQYHGTK